MLKWLGVLGLVVVIISLVIGVNDYRQNAQVNLELKNDGMGPVLFCPDDSQLGYFRKSGRPMNTFENCFAGDVAQLLQDGKLKSHLRWLSMTGQLDKAEGVLLEAVEVAAEPSKWLTELVKVKVRQRQWQAAQFYLDQSQLDMDDRLRLLVEAKTGQFSAALDQKHIPNIFQANTYQQDGLAKRAEVQSVQGLGFELTRVDNAQPGVLSGETTLSVSADGQKAWVVWTDSSGPIDPVSGLPFWRLRSAQTTNGGNSWVNDDFSINPQNQNVYHFDPMTTYDPVNEVMYAGGLTTQFSQPSQSSYYLKRWDLNSNQVSGPYEHIVTTIDKDLLAVNQTGDVFMVEGFNNQNMQVSTDFGVTFQDSFHGGNFLSPQPEFDLNDCLHIIGFNDFVRCHSQGGFESVAAPNTSLHLFTMDTYLPGSFRSIPLRLIGFHPNGDSFIIYPDLESPASDQIVLWMSRSTDGDNWQTPWVISPDVAGDRFLPWFEIDSSGGMHLSYADTRNHVVPDNDPNVGVDMYYSYSNDLGQTWQESRVTPSTLIVPELVWGDYFFSDYLEMSVGNPNAVFMAFPWFNGTGDMDLYVAKKITQDLIFADGFE